MAKFVSTIMTEDGRIEASGLVNELVKRHAAKHITFVPIDIHLMYVRLAEAVCRFLAKYKSQGHRVSVSINSLEFSHEFIVGFAADYHEPENKDDEMPGNWSIIASFNKEDIIGKPNEKVYNLQDIGFLDDIASLLSQHGGLKFEDHTFSLPLAFSLYFEALITHINDYLKNSNDDEYTINFDEYTVTGKKEDNEIVTAIELGGNFKKIIKDDTSLENIVLH